MKNRVQLIGNLGQDPVITKTNTGKQVANVSIATNERWMDKDGEWKDNVEWHRLTLWGNLAERISKQAKKGSLLAVEGKLSNRSYENKEGQQVYTTEIVVNNFFTMQSKQE